ncbi:MAG: right-handed parallel beta-helix repeat-containing protein [Eubacteriales bacterium]
MLDLMHLPNDTVVHLPSGITYLTEPVVLRGKNIRITGEDGAVVRGTVKLCREDFTETEPGVYSAAVPVPADAFYVGERKYRMARYPKASSPDLPFGGCAADCIFPEKTKDWADPSGGYLHALHRHLWGGFSYKITGKKEDGTLALTGGWQNNRQLGMHDEYRFVENIREEMTERGEWYFDEKTMRIFVRPEDGEDLDQAEAAVSRGFFLLEDCENVTIENVIFERSVRTFMETKEPLLRSDWTIYRGGAVHVKNSVNCTIDRCTFRDIGSNGVFVDGKNENIRVTRSYFTEIGASGLCFVGASDSVRSPLFEYNETQTAADIDQTPGPKSDHYPKNCTVEDCLIERVGTTEKQATGVEISMAYGISVVNCTLCHTSRAAINISEGTFGGHRIEGCDVFDTVRETGDHGCFNSWGRDRFWHLRDVDDREAGQYALLDMLAPNVLTRNRFRCDHGWDIDLDDGSSNYILTENLCLNGGIKLREGFFRTVKHNITVNNTVHFHVWYPDSGDIVEHNIVFEPYAPILMPDQWGRRVDANILHTPGLQTPEPAEELRSLSGQDAHSIRLDAGFVSPADANYRPTHPLIPGFETFPNEFGVRYEPLRAIADSPVLPVGNAVPAGGTSGSGVTLHGMTVKDIETDGEMSAYGTAEHNGALVLTVEAGSAADRHGLRAGDVVIGCGGRAVNRAADLEKLPDFETSEVVLLRGQQKMTV